MFLRVVTLLLIAVAVGNAFQLSLSTRRIGIRSSALFSEDEGGDTSEKYSAVDRVIAKAQAEAKLGIALPFEEEIEQNKRMVASMFDEGSKQLDEAVAEINDEIERGKVEYEQASEDNLMSSSADLMSKIESLTSEFEAGLPPKELREDSSTGDASVDAALAATERKIAQVAARLSGTVRTPATSCVIVTPSGGSGPIASDLEMALAKAGWTVRCVGCDLASEDAALDSDSDAYARLECAKGACVVVCPELPRDGSSAPTKKGGGGFFGGLFGKAAGANGESLSAVDARGLQALLKGPLSGAEAAVLLSCAGVQRSGVFPYSVTNTLGALDRRRAAEQALVLHSKTSGCDFSVLRVGKLEAGAGSSSSPLVLAAGDVLDGPASPMAVAGALAQVVQRAQLPALNASLGIQGTSLPSGDGGDSEEGQTRQRQAGWNELFVPVDGPELWRASLPSLKGQGGGGSESAQSATEAALAWVRLWGRGWEEDSAKKTKTGLTTKVRVKDTAHGVGLYFDPSSGSGFADKDRSKDAGPSSGRGGDGGNGPKKEVAAKRSKVGSEGGLEVVVDASFLNANDVRVRAKRCAYAEGSPVKEMSEAALLRKLKDDFARWAKTRGGSY